MRRLASPVALAFILAAPAIAQDPVSQVTVMSRREATVTIGFDDGSSVSAALRGGSFVAGSQLLTTVASDGAFANAWRAFIERLAELDAPSAYDELLAWSTDAEVDDGFTALFREAVVQPVTAPLTAEGTAPAFILAPSGPHGVLALYGSVRIGPDEVVNGGLFVAGGDVDIAGRVVGDVVALRGDVRLRRGAVVDGDVVAVRGRVRNSGAAITGRVLSQFGSQRQSVSAASRTWDNIGSVVGVFLALAALALGLTSFASKQLETGAETISASFGRSFVVGLLGQVLFIPTVIMLTVGLALTVIGVLAIPFAAAAAIALVLAGTIGGFLAVSRAAGEALAQRRVAAGKGAATMGNLGYVLNGLAIFAVMWLGAAAFTWVPVAGPVLWTTAGLVSWVAVTIGFGAALLSRFGYREAFAGRVAPQLTDEFLWPTPMATPKATVPKKRDPS